MKLTDPTVALCHRRLCHVNLAQLRLAAHSVKGLKLSIKAIGKNDRILCESCLFGKMHRAPINKDPRLKSTEKGKLIFTDMFSVQKAKQKGAAGDEASGNRPSSGSTPPRTQWRAETTCRHWPPGRWDPTTLQDGPSTL